MRGQIVDCLGRTQGIGHGLAVLGPVPDLIVGIVEGVVGGIRSEGDTDRQMTVDDRRDDMWVLVPSR